MWSVGVCLRWIPRWGHTHIRGVDFVKFCSPFKFNWFLSCSWNIYDFVGITNWISNWESISMLQKLDYVWKKFICFAKRDESNQTNRLTLAAKFVFGFSSVSHKYFWYCEYFPSPNSSSSRWRKLSASFRISSNTCSLRWWYLCWQHDSKYNSSTLWKPRK